MELDLCVVVVMLRYGFWDRLYCCHCCDVYLYLPRYFVVFSIMVMFYTGKVFSAINCKVSTSDGSAAYVFLLPGPPILDIVSTYS